MRNERFLPLITDAALAALVLTSSAAIAAVQTAGNVREWFKGPPNEYRSRSLYWLNAPLDPATLREQIQAMRDPCGFGGFAPLTLRTAKPDYLTEEFFARYGLMLELAERLGHKVIFCGDINFPTEPAVSSPAAATKDLPLPGEVFEVDGHTAFLLPAKMDADHKARGWVWYAPTLPGLPGPEERWMFTQFLEAGIAVAGIDVGESYGSPAGRALFSRFHAVMTGPRGYAPKSVLLGRSRGGLMALSWAADHPDQVAAFAGIYPVCNLASYPGFARAAGAYGMTAAELEAAQAKHNPIDRLAPLARAGVPLFAIHGDSDKVVPLEANSGLMEKRYTALGGRMQLVVPHGQGHNMWPGFFQSQELVSFIKTNASR